MANEPERIYTQQMVTELLGISRMTLLRWRRSGEFPQPTIRLGPQRVGWKSSDVVAWQESRALDTA